MAGPLLKLFGDYIAVFPDLELRFDFEIWIWLVCIFEDDSKLTLIPKQTVYGFLWNFLCLKHWTIFLCQKKWPTGYRSSVYKPSQFMSQARFVADSLVQYLHFHHASLLERKPERYSRLHQFWADMTLWSQTISLQPRGGINRVTKPKISPISHHVCNQYKLTSVFNVKTERFIRADLRSAVPWIAVASKFNRFVPRWFSWVEETVLIRHAQTSMLTVLFLVGPRLIRASNQKTLEYNGVFMPSKRYASGSRLSRAVCRPDRWHSFALLCLSRKPMLKLTGNSVVAERRPLQLRRDQCGYRPEVVVDHPQESRGKNRAFAEPCDRFRLRGPVRYG